ncbi:OmpA family protein [Methylocystis heyeri]|uniref:OmpA family protein n=1 Tax=Methylocystis heyeri TaxID=391905 RepID=A0A6B8KIY1_9HYPH|nr:OmpA family protein [Methylocystis heyeri]QGM47001.1 OmpA family protein [Methylocystis heyeri]
MVFYISHYWFWLFAIFVIGLTNGLLAKEAEKRRKISPWLGWFALAFGVGLALALLSVLGGRAGVWLETGLASFASFIAGAVAGVLARHGSLREHRNWALGLAPCVMLWWAGNMFGMPRLEAGLRQSVEAAVAKAGGDPKNLLVDGRDVLLPSSAADRAALAAEIAKVDGVRLVQGTDWVFGEKPQAGPGPENLPPANSAPANEEKADLPAKGDQGGTGAADAAKTPAERSKAAKTLLARLPSSGPLDLPACQGAIEAEQALQRIEFRGRGTAVHRAAAETLDRIAELLQRCPEAKAEIVVRADRNAEESRGLARRRAERLAQYLIAEGIASGRLSTAVRGAEPEAPGGGGRAQSIEFVLK